MEVIILLKDYDLKTFEKIHRIDILNATNFVLKVDRRHPWVEQRSRQIPNAIVVFCLEDTTVWKIKRCMEMFGNLKIVMLKMFVVNVESMEGKRIQYKTLFF